VLISIYDMLGNSLDRMSDNAQNKFI